MIGSVLSSPSLHHLSLRAILIRRPPKADKRKGGIGIKNPKITWTSCKGNEERVGESFHNNGKPSWIESACRRWSARTSVRLHLHMNLNRVSDYAALSFGSFYLDHFC